MSRYRCTTPCEYIHDPRCNDDFWFPYAPSVMSWSAALGSSPKFWKAFGTLSFLGDFKASAQV